MRILIVSLFRSEMSRLADFFCMEQSTYPTISSKVTDDQRRLRTYLEQEERFMPNNYQTRRSVEEGIRTNLLERMYEVRMLLSCKSCECSLFLCGQFEPWAVKLRHFSSFLLHACVSFILSNVVFLNILVTMVEGHCY